MFSRKSKKAKEGVLAQGQATETPTTEIPVPEHTAPVATPPVSAQSILTQPQPQPSPAAPQAAQPQIAGQEAAPNQPIDPEVAKKVAQVRSQVRESFGNVAMAMMLLPRYRNQTLGDLQHLLLEPLIRDRVAIAYQGDRNKDPLTDVSGMAIWASVSEEVDGRIREQIKTGSFPVRLKAEDWNSGEINWLLDIIAPDKKTTTNVIANFSQVVKGGNLCLHPLVARLVDPETLEKMGAQKMDGTAPTPTQSGTGSVN